MRFLLTALLACIICTQALHAQKTEDWTLRSEKNGVKVYHRNTGDVHEIKLKTRIKTRLSAFSFLLSEVEDYPTWGYKITETSLVKKISDQEMYYYARIDFPWPLNDRDMVMHSVMTQDPDTRTLYSSSKAVKGMVPLQKGVVRITDARTQWVIRPAGNGYVDLEYQLYSHPGGNLPDWLVNMAVDYGPKETLKNIESRLHDPKYVKSRLAHILD